MAGQGSSAGDDVAPAQIERAFFRALWLLRDYLPDLIIIGGWVPYLYARFSGDPWTSRASQTAEVDVLALPPLPVRGALRLDQTLRAAGLVPARDPGPSAVWTASSGSGEQVEFLTPHDGTAAKQGATVRVAGHGDIGAIGLAGLALLASRTTPLTVPVGLFEDRLQYVEVRVPCLGAYLTNKAVTVVSRRAQLDGSSPKQAKDVVYIHDVMAASDVVRQRVESDIQALGAGGGRTSRERQALRSAMNNVNLLLGGPLGRMLLPAAAAQLGERDGLTPTDADARIRGYLTDFAEILRRASGPRRRA
jgi:nucleotidyltransferase-like protein